MGGGAASEAPYTSTPPPGAAAAAAAAPPQGAAATPPLGATPPRGAAATASGPRFAAGSVMPVYAPQRPQLYNQPKQLRCGQPGVLQGQAGSQLWVTLLV